MSGSDWKHYLNGGTSQYNFSYKNNTVAPMPVVTATNTTPIPQQPLQKQSLQQPSLIPNIKPKKNNQTGGRRKRRGYLKRKTMKRKSF
jgi:hypothetical protein